MILLVMLSPEAPTSAISYASPSESSWTVPPSLTTCSVRWSRSSSHNLTKPLITLLPNPTPVVGIPLDEG